MPAKKTTKRGKVPTKAETMSVPEDTNPLSNIDEQKVTTNMNATFIVENNSNGEKSNNGLPGCGDADGIDNVAGIKNGILATRGAGDAGGFLDDIEEDEATEMNPQKNIKGKTGSKKNKLVEPESESESELVDHVDEEEEVSPKRALEEDEDMVQGPPSKRREKTAKKVTSRRDRKAKVELEVMAPEENADENTSPEEAAEDETVEQVPPKRGRGGKAAPSTKKGRKGKGDVEAEPSGEKPKTKESSPENDSPMEMDGDEDAEDVDDAKEDPKPAKKRAGRVAKEKPVLEPSTRTTRSRKQVTYAEKEDDEEEPEDFKDRKIKKTTTSKKAPAQTKKPKEVAQKPAASTKRKGRPPKATTEMKKEEEADE